MRGRGLVPALPLPAWVPTRGASHLPPNPSASQWPPCALCCISLGRSIFTLFSWAVLPHTSTATVATQYCKKNSKHCQRDPVRWCTVRLQQRKYENGIIGEAAVVWASSLLATHIFRHRLITMTCLFDFVKYLFHNSSSSSS